MRWSLRRFLGGVWVGAVVWLVGVALVAVGPAAAHGGSVGGRSSVTVPTWLVLLTGGAAVGASFLLASLVTDRRLVRTIDSWRGRLLAGVRAPLPAVVAGLASLGGIGILLVVVAVGLLGPTAPLSNLAILLVWVGWWAGYTATTYLVGNTWPALNPWRTLTASLPSLDRPYPAALGSWPALLALLGLVWIEVASPVAESPRFLVLVIAAYTVVTVAGATVFGTDTWFARADPIARVFRYYGHVAPVDRRDGSVSLRLPGTGLTDLDLGTRSDVAFAVALVWVTTFDGLVTTPAWRSAARALVGAGMPPVALYPLGLGMGFLLFYGAYRLAARVSRRAAESYLTVDELGRRFAPSLVAIAAGYHLAHYLGYLVSTAPAVVAVAAEPFARHGTVPQLIPPPWFEVVGMGAVLLGHLLAIWVAHAAAFRTFPGRLQAIRSQYPFVAVMVLYTMSSLWIVAQPAVPVPYT